MFCVEASTNLTPPPASLVAGEIDPDFSATWIEGLGWVVCYSQEEADEVGGEIFGFHPFDLDLAFADLVRQYPREV